MNGHRSTPEWDEYEREYNRLAHENGHLGFWEGISDPLTFTNEQSKYLHTLAVKAIAADTARWKASRARYSTVS